MKFVNVVLNNLYVLKQIYSVSPLYIFYNIVWIIINVISQLIWIVMLPIIINIIASDKDKLGTIIIAFIVSGIYFILSELFLRLTQELYSPKAEIAIREYFQKQLYQKAKQVDLSCYEKTSFYNDFMLAASEFDKRALKLIYDLRSTILSFLVFFGSLAVILSYDFISIVFALISVLGSYIVNWKMKKIDYNCELNVLPVRRRRDYLFRVFYLRDYAKELRLYPEIATKFIGDYKNANNNVKNIYMKYAKYDYVSMFLKQFVFNTFLYTGLMITYLAHRLLIAGTISLGGFYAIFYSCGSINQKLSTLVSSIPNLYENSLYIEKVKKFLDYEVQIKDGDKALIKKESPFFVINDMTFSYSKDSSPVLKNLSMRINNGDHIAIVGMNGAGKSTFIKLLLRLYQSDKGSILMNQHNITEYQSDAYKKGYAVLFQDFKLFSFSITENVEMGQEKKDQTRLIQALQKVGIYEKILELPKQLDTSIGTEFDQEGVYFSGGEEQRIALARIFFKDADLVIVDEPCSYLDPILENQLNELIFNEMRHKTVIFVTHRLSISKMVDKIYVFDDGEIKEEGSHKNLIQKGGLYAKMYLMQAKNYNV